MRLLCTVLALALWGCDGWPKETPGRSAGLEQEPPRSTRAKDAKAPHAARRVPKASLIKPHHPGDPHQSLAGFQHGLQAGRGQCLVNGMAMYDGAAWAPNPCTMCICDRGKQVCEPMDCEAIKCPVGRLQTPPGGCCPICTEPATRPKPVSTTGRPKHGAVKAEKKGKVQGKQQRESKIQEQALPEKKKKSVRSSSQMKKEVPEKKQNGTSSRQWAVTRKEPAATRDTEGALKKLLVTTGSPKRETSGQGSPGGVGHGQEVLPVKGEAGNKKRETPSPKRPEASKPSIAPEEAQHRLDPKEGQEKRPVPEKHIKEKIQRKKPLMQDNNEEEGYHIGHKENKDAALSQGPDSDLSLGPASRLADLPIPETETHMPSLPTGCLLAEFTIACANTKMKHIPALTDSVLKTLYLAENEISQLPVDAFSGLPNLEWLDLSKNKLDDAGVHMDVFKNLTKLKRLNLDGNRLTAVPPLPPLLQELKMNDNGLQGLHRHSFRGLYKLLTLELEGNNFHDGNVYPLSFKPLRSLIYLRLDRNRFRAVPSGLPTSLQELHLDNNRIEQVSEGLLNKTLNLSVLVLSNNRLQEDRIATRAWIDLPKLESLDLSYNRLVHVPSFLPRGLRQLTLHHNQIERIPGYVFAHMKPGLEFLHLSHNHLREDGIHAVSFLGLYKSLAELLLDNNHLHAVPRGILNLKALQVLRLSFNRIRYVPLNSICDTRVSVDSSLISVHLENNLIDRRLIPPTAFSCIKTYYSVVLRPQQDEDEDYY